MLVVVSFGMVIMPSESMISGISGKSIRVSSCNLEITLFCGSRLAPPLPGWLTGMISPLRNLPA